MNYLQTNVNKLKIELGINVCLYISRDLSHFLIY